MLRAQQVIYQRLAARPAPGAKGSHQLFRRRSGQLLVHVAGETRVLIGLSDFRRVSVHRLCIAAIGRFQRRLFVSRIVLRALDVVRQLVHDHLSHLFARADSA